MREDLCGIRDTLIKHSAGEDIFTGTDSSYKLLLTTTLDNQITTLAELTEEMGISSEAMPYLWRKHFSVFVGDITKCQKAIDMAYYLICGENKSITDMCRVMDMDLPSVTHTFNRYLGMPPRDIANLSKLVDQNIPMWDKLRSILSINDSY